MKIITSNIVMTFETDNAAFDDGNKEYEINRIKTEALETAKAGDTEGRIRDINGNTIGSWRTKR